MAITTKDINGFMLMKLENGNMLLQVVANGSENMSVVEIDMDVPFEVSAVLDSLSTALEVEGSLSEAAVLGINAADERDAEAENAISSEVEQY